MTEPTPRVLLGTYRPGGRLWDETVARLRAIGRWSDAASEIAPVGPVSTGVDLLLHTTGELEERDLERLRDNADEFERLPVHQIIPRDNYGNRFEVDAVDEFQGAVRDVMGRAPRNGD